MATLLTAFEENPQAVIRELRMLPGIRDRAAGEVFSLVVFLSDSYLRLSPPRGGMKGQEDGARRFFLMAQALPIELQMVLCNRLFHSLKDIVLCKFSEPAFRRLGKVDGKR